MYTDFLTIPFFVISLSLSTVAIFGALAYIFLQSLNKESEARRVIHKSLYKKGWIACDGMLETVVESVDTRAYHPFSDIEHRTRILHGKPLNNPIKWDVVRVTKKAMIHAATIKQNEIIGKENKQSYWSAPSPGRNFPLKVRSALRDPEWSNELPKKVTVLFNPFRDYSDQEISYI